MKARILLFVLICFCALTAGAEATYMITALPPGGSLKIDSKKLKVGDTFSEKATINWDNATTWVEVTDVNSTSGRRKVITQKAAETSKSNSLWDFFLKTTHGSAKGEISCQYTVWKSSAADLYTDKKIAFVVGNSNYIALDYLKNSQRDASLVSNTLHNIGFDIFETYECTKDELDLAFANFLEYVKQNDYDMALVYYSGHGMEIDGNNYFIPIDASLDIQPRQAKPAQPMLTDLAKDCGLRHVVMVLDACRVGDNHPMILEDVNLDSYVMLLSTAKGELAYDGAGNNSEFASQFTKWVTQKGLRAGEALDSVAAYTTGQKVQKIGTIKSPIFGFNIPKASISTQEMGDMSIYKPTLEVDTDNMLFDMAMREYDKSNYDKALNLLMNFKSLPEAQYYIAQCWYHSPNKDKKTEKEYIKWLTKSAEQGNGIALTELILAYYLGDGVKQSYTKAYKYCQYGTSANYARAEWLMGLMCEEGKCVKQNYKEALTWYIKAYYDGCINAAHQIGEMYYWGDKAVSIDYEEAVKWLKEAAKNGNSSSMNLLGICYNYGRGVDQNYDEAAKWLKNAAMARNVAALENLGRLYYHGHGVEQDYNKAYYYFEEAHKMKNRDATFLLADLCFNGKGCDQNYKKSLELYELAANDEHYPSMYLCGYMYWAGLGCSRDIDKAEKYLQKATIAGITEAQDLLNDINKERAHNNSEGEIQNLN